MRYNFQKFGVKIGIETDQPEHLKAVREQLAKVFPNGLENIDEDKVEYRFALKSKADGKIEFLLNEELIVESVPTDVFFEVIESQIRTTIAEFAVGKVFLHAGVIGWKNQAVIIPAQSFSGKSTLVAELVRQGAVYYSDEYAVLDEKGNVEPFPKWLSLRGIIDQHRQLDCSVESLGGVAGTETIPVKMVLIAKYNEKKKTPKRWQPRRLTEGQAVMEILPHTLPIRNKPKFVLEVLNKLTSRAIIVKTIRGEAREFARTLLTFLDKQAG